MAPIPLKDIVNSPLKAICERIGPIATLYIGRHTSQECMQAIGLVPKFVRAGSMK